MARANHILTALLVALLSTATAAKSANVDFEDLLAPSQQDLDKVPALAMIGTKLDAGQKLQLRQALVLFGKSEFAQAEIIARRLTEVAPQEPDAWYLFGLLLANLDRREEAVVALDEATKRYEVNSDPLVIKGDLLLSMGQSQSAVAAWEMATQRDPANWRAQERLAAQAEQSGDLAEARRRYEQSISASGARRSFPRLQLARLALLSAQPEAVEQWLKEIAASENAPDEALDYLSRAFIAQDRLGEAEPLLIRLVERGTTARAFPNLARILLTRQQVAEAEALMARAAKVFPDNADILLEQGRILGAVGKYDDAIAAFEAGLSKAPGNRALLNAASLAKARSGAIVDAVAFAQEAVRQADASTGDRVWLAGLLEQTGAAADAEALYRQILETEPENWLVLNNLASLLTATDPQAALALAEKAFALQPQSVSVGDTLGWAQFKTGRIDAALATYQSLRSTSPDTPLLAYRMGLILASTGRAAEAKAHLEEALQKDPTSTYSEMSRMALEGKPISP